MATAYIEAIRKWARNLFKTVKLNCYNWLCFWILVAAGGIIEGTTKPTARYLSPSDWDDVKYPTKSDTVPASWLFVIALAVPIVVFTVYHFSHGCEIREYHDLLFGIVMNVVLTGVATDALKMGLGRPRPDFYERCFGHVYNNVTDIPPPSIERPDCTNTNESTVEEGRKSFPSGHASLTMCSMFYLTLFFVGKSHAFDGKGRAWTWIVSLLPICVAIAVGVTRILDYRHFYTDVLVGWFLGIMIATVLYLTYYPWPFAKTGTSTPLYKTSEQDQNRNHIRLESETENDLENEGVPLRREWNDTP